MVKKTKSKITPFTSFGVLLNILIYDIRHLCYYKEGLIFKGFLTFDNI